MANSPQQRADDRQRLEAGRRSIAGCLFEPLGAIADELDRAAAEAAILLHQVRISPDRAEWDCNAIVTLGTAVQGGARSADLNTLLQCFGQDVVVINPEAASCSLEQYKLSVEVERRKIGKGELVEIAQALSESHRMAVTRGLRVTGYRLTTNRPLTEDAEEEVLHALVRLQERFPDAVHEGDFASGDWYAHGADVVLATIDIVRVGVEELRDRIVKVGASYGIDEMNCLAAIDGLVGQLFNRVADEGSARVSRREILNALTGSPDARPLTLPALRPKSQALVNAFADDHFGDVPEQWGKYVRRSVVADVSKAATQTPIVFVLGDGGRGKSVAVTQLVIDMLANTETLVLVETVDALTEFWVARVFGAWAGLRADSPRAGEPLAAIVARLRRANPLASRPVLVLVVDGADEVGPGFPTEERVVGLAREVENLTERSTRPDVVLIVTCRKADETSVSRFRGGSGVELVRDQTRLQVVAFSDEELQDGLATVPQRVATEIMARLQGSEAVEFRSQSELLGRELSRGSNSSVGLPDWLREPVAWSSFVDMEESVQLKALDEDPDALLQIGNAVVSRFLNKAPRRRRLRASGWDRDDVQRVLAVIADASTAEPLPKNAWRTLALTAGVGTLQADALLREAVSAGLISDEGVQWRWRYEFVRRAAGTGADS